MALIKCPECGKEISDTCDTCIHCGYKLHPENNTANKKTSDNHRLVIILVCVVIAIGVIIASVLIVNSIRENNRIKQEKQEQVSMQQEEEQREQEEAEAEIEAHKLSYEEKVCYYAIEYFKTILKNPDSLQIHDVKISVSLSADDIHDFDKSPDEHYSQYAIGIDNSAQNGLGGSQRDVYYIIMNGFTVADETYQDQSIVEIYYSDRRSIDVSTDKIKYALDHPEVLDY